MKSKCEQQRNRGYVDSLCERIKYLEEGIYAKEKNMALLYVAVNSLAAREKEKDAQIKALRENLVEHKLNEMSSLAEIEMCKKELEVLNEINSALNRQLKFACKITGMIGKKQ